VGVILIPLSEASVIIYLAIVVCCADTENVNIVNIMAKKVSINDFIFYIFFPTRFFDFSDYSGQSMPVIPDESMPLYQRTNG